MPAEHLQRAKAVIERAERDAQEHARAEGAVAQVREELRERYGDGDLKALLERAEEESCEADEVLARMCDRFERKYGDRLGG